MLQIKVFEIPKNERLLSFFVFLSMTYIQSVMNIRIYSNNSAQIYSYSKIFGLNIYNQYIQIFIRWLWATPNTFKHSKYLKVWEIGEYNSIKYERIEHKLIFSHELHNFNSFLKRLQFEKLRNLSLSRVWFQLRFQKKH